MWASAIILFPHMTACVWSGLSQLLPLAAAIQKSPQIHIYLPFYNIFQLTELLDMLGL